MNKSTMQIPVELVTDFEVWAHQTARLFGRLRRQSKTTGDKFFLPIISQLDKPSNIPKEDEWFWSDEWQQMEREADEDLAAGNYDVFGSIEELLADMQKET